MKNETNQIIIDYLLNSLEHAPDMHVAVGELSEVAMIERQKAAEILYLWVSIGHHLDPLMNESMALKLLSKITDK